jgi:ABC-2 type transport system ATP-binding protein
MQDARLARAYARVMTVTGGTEHGGTPLISIEGLTKSFGATYALQGLDLTVQPGEVHGFLGPNGAGKSTTLRILLGMLKSDGGRVQLLGQDPWRNAVALHRRVAYVPGDVALWPSLTGGETIDVLGRLRGGIDQRRKTELIERFSLNPTTKAQAYSKGNRQKVGLIAALATDAELYLLDEPTDGLDPLMAENFREVVQDLGAQGRTVLLSSHVLAEVEAVCERITIIRAGRTVESGSLSRMRHLARTSVSATTSRPVPELTTLPGVHDLSLDETGTTITCTVEPAAVGAVLQALAAADVVAIESRPPTLEEMFLRYYDNQGAAT